MRIVVLGGDGYCGWATALYLKQRPRGRDCRQLFRRQWDHELGAQTLTPIRPLSERLKVWQELTGKTIEMFVGDVTDYDFLASTVKTFEPEAVVHFAEQRSAPYSMIDRKHAVVHAGEQRGGHAESAVRAPRIRVRIATWSSSARWASTARRISISKKATSRSSTTGARTCCRFPSSRDRSIIFRRFTTATTSCSPAGSGDCAPRTLNQGVVYGTLTDEVALDEALINRFDYDEVFGTVLNRFCVQAAIGHPLTVYGKGGQTRGFLDIRDTVRCIELACLNPAARGECRVFNQFTEQFSVLELAHMVQNGGAKNAG